MTPARQARAVDAERNTPSCLTSPSWPSSTSLPGTRPTRPRGALIGEIWSEDGRYLDPLAQVTGRDQIDAVIAAAQAQFADMTFRLAGPVDAHHDQARFTWELGPDGAEALVVGFDVAQRDAGGRLALVLGFLDKVPSAGRTSHSVSRSVLATVRRASMAS